MFKEKRVIIFDLDGTLLDSIGMWNDVDKKLVQSIGGTSFENVQLEREIFLKNNTYANTYVEYARYLKTRHNSLLSVEEIYNLRAKISDNYLRNVVDFKPNAADFIRELKFYKFAIVLASLTTRVPIEIYRTSNNNIKSKCDFDSAFDLILTNESVSNKKPHPEIYLKAMQAMNAKASECLVFEDSLSGIKSAKGAGIEVVAVYDRYSDCDREEIIKLSDYNVDEYATLVKKLKDENSI